MSAPACSASSDPSTAAASSGSKRAHPDAAAAERRVLPRHFHSGSNPSAVASSCGDVQSHAAAAIGPAPAARLYRHALECIFSFLQRGELVSSLQVSREWLAAVRSMAILGLRVNTPRVPLRLIASSAIGRHVTSLDAEGLTPSPKSVSSLHAKVLRMLAQRMPQLHTLIRFDLPVQPSAAGPLLFPAALHTLDIRVLPNVAAAHVNVALEAIGHLQLLDSFAIYLHQADPLLSFAPLAAAPRLNSLNIYLPHWAASLSDAQVDELRALTRLQNMSVLPTSTELLRRLLHQPHVLQWQEIGLPTPLDDEAAALLPQLPSITKLGCWTQCTHFEWMPALPNLATVRLYVDESPVAGRMASLVAALPCTPVQELRLRGGPEITAEHLAELLPRLPRLRGLSLQYLRVRSLSFLARAPLTQQLSRLELDHCTRLPLTELRHVHALRALESLRLDGSFDERMDSHCQTFYAPPSLPLPQLRRFFYAAPVLDDDDHDDHDDNDDGDDAGHDAAADE